MPRPHRAAVLVVAGLLLAWCAVFPYRLTDGDSCLYAALGHEMATTGAWLAPHWAFQGAPACFHENPPAAAWPAGLLELLGVPDGQAPLVANALWLLLLLGSLAWLPGPGHPSPWLAPLLLLLLHEPVWRYAARFGLEIPFAACATAALAAGRRRATPAVLLAGSFLALAALVRGVFAVPVAVLLLLDAVLGREGPAGLRRRGGAILWSLLLLVVFDLGHRAAAGHSFWWAHLQRQILPSLEPGGTIHPNRSSTLLYYGGRLLVYAAPAWLLLGLAWRRRRLLPQERRDRLLALAWVLLFFAGVALARRQGSRYLFAVWPATALLAAGALRGLRPALAAAGAGRGLATGTLAVALLLTAGKGLASPRDAWWRSADLLREARSRIQAPIYGPFGPQDDRAKQFLRHHAGTWAFAAPPAVPEPGGLRWLPVGAPGPRDATRVLETPLGRLVR